VEDLEIQDQVVEVRETPVAGELSADHPTDVTPEVEEPGGEEKETPKKEAAPKTFTEEEVTEREAKITSDLQKQKAEAEGQLNRLRYEEQIRQVQQAEAAALAQDREQAEQGYIGEDVVQQRQQARQATKQLVEQAQGLHGVVQQLRTEGEMLSMVTTIYHVAKEAAKEDGLSEFQTIELFDQLMKEGKYSSPDQVRGKVATLRLKKVKEALRAASIIPENFDHGAGASNSGGVDLNKLSIDELAEMAYSTKKK